MRKPPKGLWGGGDFFPEVDFVAGAHFHIGFDGEALAFHGLFHGFEVHPDFLHSERHCAGGGPNDENVVAHMQFASLHEELGYTELTIVTNALGDIFLDPVLVHKDVQQRIPFIEDQVDNLLIERAGMLKVGRLAEYAAVMQSEKKLVRKIASNLSEDEFQDAVICCGKGHYLILSFVRINNRSDSRDMGQNPI